MDLGGRAYQIYYVKEFHVHLSRTVSFQDFQYRKHSMGRDELREHFRGVCEDDELNRCDCKWRSQRRKLRRIPAGYMLPVTENRVQQV